MNQTEIRETLADLVAIAIILTIAYQSIMLIAVSQELAAAAGAAVAYLFIKNSPNSV